MRQGESVLAMMPFSSVFGVCPKRKAGVVIEDMMIWRNKIAQTLHELFST